MKSLNETWTMCNWIFQISKSLLCIDKIENLIKLLSEFSDLNHPTDFFDIIDSQIFFSLLNLPWILFFFFLRLRFFAFVVAGVFDLSLSFMSATWWWLSENLENSLPSSFIAAGGWKREVSSGERFSFIFERFIVVNVDHLMIFRSSC